MRLVCSTWGGRCTHSPKDASHRRFLAPEASSLHRCVWYGAILNHAARLGRHCADLNMEGEVTEFFGANSPCSRKQLYRRRL
jgi:hypothetical protein